MMNGKKMNNKRRIEGVRIFVIPDFLLKGAFALPGIGIFVNVHLSGNQNLLMHEFGHILQYRMYGWKVFFFKIAPVSFMSALKARIQSNHLHKTTWTEFDANRLAYQYFKEPADWDFRNFPVNA